MTRKRNVDMEVLNGKMKRLAKDEPKPTKEEYDRYPVNGLDPKEKWRKEFVKRIKEAMGLKEDDPL